MLLQVESPAEYVTFRERYRAQKVWQGLMHT